MNLYYFGDMQEYIQAGYAPPTGRAKCKGCKQLIEKDSVRIGTCMDNPNDHANFGGKSWCHQQCFTLKPRFKDLDPEQQIYNLDHLDPQHYEAVLAHVQAEVQRLKQGKRATKKKAPIKEVSKKQEQKDDQKDDDQSYQQVKPKKGKSKSKSKAATKKSDKASQKSQRSASKSVAKSSKSKASKSAQKKGKKKSAKKQQPKSGYTPAQKAQYQQLFQKYMGMSADALKNILATNLQSRTGNKSDLAEKCADGKILGRIPMCSSCGGGRLRFDRKTGVYACPGYMDDDVFRNCGKKYTMQDVTRDPWTEP